MRCRLGGPRASPDVMIAILVLQISSSTLSSCPSIGLSSPVGRVMAGGVLRPHEHWWTLSHSKFLSLEKIVNRLVTQTRRWRPLGSLIDLDSTFCMMEHLGRRNRRRYSGREGGCQANVLCARLWMCWSFCCCPDWTEIKKMGTMDLSLVGNILYLTWILVGLLILVDSAFPWSI